MSEQTKEQFEALEADAERLGLISDVTTELKPLPTDAELKKIACLSSVDSALYRSEISAAYAVYDEYVVPVYAALAEVQKELKLTRDDKDKNDADYLRVSSQLSAAKQLLDDRKNALKDAVVEAAVKMSLHVTSANKVEHILKICDAVSALKKGGV